MSLIPKKPIVMRIMIERKHFSTFMEISIGHRYGRQRLDSMGLLIWIPCLLAEVSFSTKDTF